MTDLLATRNKSKARKPRFERGQSGIMPQFQGTWRRPRGMHNKMRLGLRGKRVGPAVGYKSPTEVRGLERSGVKAVVVHNIEDLGALKKNEGVLLSSSLGLRKRAEIIKKILEKKLLLLNLKNPQEFLQKLEQTFAGKKEKKISSKKESTKKEPEEKTKSVPQ